MISTRWLDQRRPYWRQLNELVDRAAAQGLSGLAREELQALGGLYRQVAADLATVREDPSADAIAVSLNQLLTRAHHTVYASEPVRAAAGARAILEEFPRAVRAHIGHCLVALALILAGGAIGAILTYRDPDFKAQVLGPQMIATIEQHKMWTHSIVAIKPLASSTIMTNNMSVAFTMFAGGATAGIGTAWLLLLNGVLLGAVGVACAEAGMSLALWSFVAPHGVLEIPSIVIAGAAGLRLGQGLLFPGLLPRRDALVEAGRTALRLLIGCVPLLIVAGLVEAFVSPTDLSVPLKFTTAAALSALLAIYLGLGGLARASSASV